ncbi:MAG: DUF5060 domain-containing protein, partial [Anaerolineaceae bacterium]|nr:DUF5060 domain-containing protein [Anaerolineaceae bacterium]
MRHQIEQWGLFELVFHGSTQNNPFIDVTLQATFTHEETSFKINGFYDGDDTYRVRFMPNQTGIWHYTIESSLAEIGEQSGSFECIAPSPDNHGPVVIKDQDHFAYADGTKYYPFGTTAYAWNHQEPERVAQTIETLRTAPFNKMRMCLFPKSYLYNQNEPPLYPFEGEPLTHWDLEHFNPAYFRQLERCILALQEMNIEVDLILFHEYDRWNFAHLPVEV